MKVACPYCGSAAEFVDSAAVHGRSYGMIYLCRPCQAWVGTHKGSSAPLGRLANSELREARVDAHAAFDHTWKSGTMRRKDAYAWLAGQLSIRVELCHIAMFDVDQCKQVVKAMIRRGPN